MKIDKKLLRSIFFGVAGCILLYWLLNEWDLVKRVWDYVRNLVEPFVVGAALAFVLNVPMRGIEKLLKNIPSDKGRRALAMVLTLLLIALIVTGVVVLLIPQLEETIRSLTAQLPEFFKRLERELYDFLSDRPEVMQWVNANIDLESWNWSSLIEKVVGTVGNSLAALLNSTITVVGTFTGAVVDAVISVVFAFYCLCSKETLARQARKLGYALLPEKACDETVRILRMTNSAFSNFITGQCLEAVILALLFVITMAVFRMPYIPLICVIICVTALVPMVGAFVGCVLGAFFILVNDPMQAVTFVIMFLVVQQFENNVIYPRVVGSSIGLSGMWVLLAVTIGGSTMGVAGMLLMVPFASVLYTLLREFTQKRLAARGIDEDKLRPHPPKLQSHLRLKHEKIRQQHHLWKMRVGSRKKQKTADSDDTHEA